MLTIELLQALANFVQIQFESVLFLSAKGKGLVTFFAKKSILVAKKSLLQPKESVLVAKKVFLK